jgi:hypothetical protein
MDEKYGTNDGDEKHVGFKTLVRNCNGKRSLLEFESVWEVTVK